MLRHRRLAIVLSLAGLFAFRLFYGLSMPFWSEDERQVYLIGLQSFTRGEWPFYGADVVWTGAQVPGALLGLLIRLPLEIWPAPESPIVLLNALSFGAIGFLAWYFEKRLPRVPSWLIWASLMTLPWTLNFSTHIVNPSYVLAGGVLFFVGFFEAMPALRRNILPVEAAWALMGAGLGWVMQLHMSWVLLPPYVVAALVGVLVSRVGIAGLTRGQVLARVVTGFVIGAVMVSSLLLPTVIRDGLSAGGFEGAVEFHGQSPASLVTTTARALSFASFETNRFLGQSTTERVLVVVRQPWILPFVLIVAAAGILQPLWMVVSAFRRTPGDTADWLNVRMLFVATIVLIFTSFFFSIRGPQAHAFYVVLPVSVLFAFTCWSERARARGGRLPRLERMAMIVIGAGVLMHTGLAIDRLSRQSLYVDRDLVAAAITDRNDRYLGDRRAVAVAPQATDDLQVTQARWTPRAGRISSFEVTVTNRSSVDAWLDIRFVTKYTGADGAALGSRDLVVKQILQPGQTRTWVDVADGFVPAGTTGATIEITGAEKVIPRRSY